MKATSVITLLPATIEEVDGFAERLRDDHFSGRLTEEIISKHVGGLLNAIKQTKLNLYVPSDGNSLVGTITQIQDAVRGSKGGGANWVKVGFVLDMGGYEDNKVLIYAFNQLATTLPDIGTRVKVSLTMKSREYNGKWYTDVVARDVEVFK
jgi:hypothetical protein